MELPISAGGVQQVYGQFAVKSSVLVLHRRLFRLEAKKLKSKSTTEIRFVVPHQATRLTDNSVTPNAPPPHIFYHHKSSPPNSIDP